MKIYTVLGICCLLFAVATAQRQEDRPVQEFVAIFRLQLSADDPPTEFRVVIRAKTEGAATVKAMKHLQTLVTDWSFKNMEFIEVGPARGTPPKEEKK